MLGFGGGGLDGLGGEPVLGGESGDRENEKNNNLEYTLKDSDQQENIFQEKPFSPKRTSSNTKPYE